MLCGGTNHVFVGGNEKDWKGGGKLDYVAKAGSPLLRKTMSDDNKFRKIKLQQKKHTIPSVVVFERPKRHLL
jgi:hypothetical protein